MAETSNNLVESVQSMIHAMLGDVNTCLPGKIVSYENGVARVAPTVKKRYADGDVLDYPIIPNVRVCWPSFAGGTAGVKGPVKAGDKCLIVFSQQAVDGSDDRRAFDLSDAYCIMCDLGGTAGESSNNSDMVVYYGGASVKLSAAGKVTITAPAGLHFETPATTNKGTLTTDGLLTYKAGMSGTGGGASTTISGNMTHSGGSITSNGVTLHTHTHSGVQTGGGNTGAPN
jgi:phage baseplate assembly protein gpV